MSSLPRRSVYYSQNFLKNSCLIASLVAQSSISSCDIVYEIGPGKGAITRQLGQHSQHVIAIEKDPYLAKELRQTFAHAPNITIFEGDFLRFHLPCISYKVFANIPFNITAAIVTKLTSAPCPPEDTYLVMQKEAAYKFLGVPRQSLYAILLKPWFEGEIVHCFRRCDFVPDPRVDVVMLRLRKRGPPLIKHTDRQRFRDFVVYSFTAWQPTLSSVFKDIFTPQQLKHLSHNIGFSLHAPPSSLEFEQWLKLFDYFKQTGSNQAIQMISNSEKRLRQQQAGLQKLHRTRALRKK